MPRPRRCCRVSGEPAWSVYKPAGTRTRDLDEAVLTPEALEALRLADMEGLYHEAAAERMGVSRPTFGRLLQEARATVAQALVRGMALVIRGETGARPCAGRSGVCAGRARQRAGSMARAHRAPSSAPADETAHPREEQP